MMHLLTDLWGMMRERKKFWLGPMILFFLLIGTLVVLGQGSAITPFIYAVF